MVSFGETETLVGDNLIFGAVELDPSWDIVRVLSAAVNLSDPDVPPRGIDVSSGV
jgi:hypothetical protein